MYKDSKTAQREKTAIEQLEQQKIPKNKLSTPVSITALFVLESNRRRDLSNMRQSIEDILVKYDLLLDDDCKIISDLHLIYNGTNKETAGCMIRLSYKPTETPAIGKNTTKRSRVNSFPAYSDRIIRQ